MSFNGPIALNVKVVVKPDRRDEFLKVITKDAEQTVATEPGALQFTLGEEVGVPNTFHFHEQYKQMKDFEFHQTTSHFSEWKQFCDTDPFECEPVVNIYQCNHEAREIPSVDRKAYCLNVEVCIKPEKREAFLESILQNQKGSRETEEKCIQYDLGESVDEQNKFYIHEEYSGGKSGLDEHNASPHFKKWGEFANSGPFTQAPVISIYETMK